MDDSPVRDLPVDASTPTDELGEFRWPHTGETEEEARHRTLLSQLDAVYHAADAARSCGATLPQVVCAAAGPQVRDQLAERTIAEPRPGLPLTQQDHLTVQDCLTQLCGLMTLSGVRPSTLATRLGVSRSQLAGLLSGPDFSVKELSALVRSVGGTLEIFIRLSDEE